MAWGNEASNEPTTAMCEYPGCSNEAHVIVEATIDGEPRKLHSCIEHSNGLRIVGIIEGSGVDESIVKRLIEQHEAAKITLEKAKNSELEARLMLANYSMPVAGRKEGVNNMELGDGRVVKVGHKVNYNLTGDNDKIEKVEEEADKIGNEGTFLIERIITWKAAFSKSEYNKLDESNPTHLKIKKLVDSILETKEGTPTLEVKEPKAKLNG